MTAAQGLGGGHIGGQKGGRKGGVARVYISQEEEEYLRSKGRILCDWCKHQPDNWPEVVKRLHKYASGPWCKAGKSVRGSGALCHCSDYSPFQYGRKEKGAEQLRLF